MNNMRAVFELFRFLMQRIAVVVIVSLALGVLGYVALCAFGLAPWPELAVGIGGAPESVGPQVALVVGAFMLSLQFFLPSHARVMALETSHRGFHMGMRDVARAYALAHTADREGAFTLKSEFDSVRERIAFLREHPDLGDLEPAILEIAAQMSHVSGELARTYSNDNLSRARDFLTARQQEIESFEQRLVSARAAMEELRPWVARVQSDEAVANKELARIADELRLLLPEIWGAEDRTAQPEATPGARPGPLPATGLMTRPVQGPAAMAGADRYPVVGLHAAE